MNDHHPTEILSAYLDGEVTTEERLEIARHLEACEECRLLLDGFQTMAAAAVQEPPPPVPAGMVARIVAALGRSAPEPRRISSWRFPLPLAVAAGLLVVVTGTWVLLRRQPGPQPVAVAQAVREDQPPEQATPDDLAGRRRELAPPPSESQSGQSNRPAAAPPPIAEGAQPKKDAAPASRSLDDREHLRQEAPTAALEAPASAPSTPAPGLMAPSESDAKSRAAVGEEAGRTAGYRAAALEPGGRSIVFEFEGAKGTLTEAGLLRLVLDQRACSVDLSAAPATREEVRTIFRLAPAAPAARTAAGETQEQGPGRPLKLIRVLSPASSPLEAADVEQVEERLWRLLKVTARDSVESRCGGPLPLAVPGE